MSRGCVVAEALGRKGTWRTPAKHSAVDLRFDCRDFWTLVACSLLRWTATSQVSGVFGLRDVGL